MNIKRMGEDAYEIYLPEKREWTLLEQIQDFLKQLEKDFSLLENGLYHVYVTINDMGTLFEVQQIENYVSKRSVDLKIELYKAPFYLKSETASVFSKGCFYFQDFFYGKSNQLSLKFQDFEWVERISEQEYKMAQKYGCFIKKRRGVSSL